MRALALDADLILLQSGVWQTNAVAVRSGSEAFLIDSPILPDELEMLADVLEESGFPIVGLLATHADWDHLLGPIAFPGVPLAVSETSAARLKAEPGSAARELRDFDDRWYLQRKGTLSIPGAEALPVPGLLEIGERELELHPADGHTADGMAIFARWCGVLICGDYVSPIEIPMISDGGSIAAYRATLLRLRDLVGEAEHVVPGHGEPIDPVRAEALITEDLAYLDALEQNGAAAPLPLARRNKEQLRIHAENAELVSRR